MRLRSTGISKSEKAESVFSLENCDAVDETMGSFSCDFEPLLDGLAEKMARKTEDMVFFDKPVNDLEAGMCKRENSTIMEDQNVLISTESVISVAVKEGKDFVTVSSNELDPSLKEAIKLSPPVLTNTYQRKVLVPTSQHKEAMEYKKLSANIQPRSIVDDDNDIKMVSSNEGIKASHVTLVDSLKDCENTDNSRQKKEDTMVSLYVECKKEADNGFLTIDENGEGVHGIKRKKRGRKRKNLESSESDGDVRGKIEKVENRVLRSRRLTKSGNVKVDESGLNESYVRFKIKMEAECINQTELKDVKKNSQLSGQPKKKQKRRGRPPKAQGGHTLLHVTDDVAVSKKVERRGRPPKGRGKKGQTGKSSKLLTNAEKSNLMVDEKVNNQLKGKDVKKGDKIPKVQNQDGRLERREIQQLVRDKIANMLMKAGWTIEHRPRKNRAYLDAVYVDLNGGTHWSVTKAYYSLKKRIEDDNAEIQEVSAFTPVPDEEISVLFRVVTKVRSDKQKARKKGKRGKSTSDESEDPVKKKRKKKLKDDKKKKEVNKSDVKSGNKPLKRVKRQPNVSQKCQHSRKPRLVARSSSKGNDEDNDGSLIYNGKRNLVSWMIGLGVIMPGGKVQYSEGKRRNGLLEGKVTHDGIHCSCCNETLTISSFVSHGGGKVNQALKNIYFQSSSLLKCLLESWRKEEKSNTIRFNLVDTEGDDPNDDTCNICGDGGDLICCDGCPSTFHQSCLDIENFPSGVWHCVYCSCKFCGHVSQIDDSEMISCCFCEEKFHGLCLQEDDAPNLDSSGLSFCGRECQEIFEKIKTYVGVKFELEDEFSWSLLQRADVSDDSVLVNAPEKIECNSKLAVAFSVMDECFVPIMDERSGVNVIHDVVYNCGSNFRRLNYSGFFTAVLERGDEMIAAASIRIHGSRLAEMPFIGTRHMYRRQGMCRRLLDGIESALSSLGVKELVIPAIPELYKTWTNVFGFKPLKKSKRQAIKSISMIVFPGLDILQKPLNKDQFADKIHDDKANDDIALHSVSKPSIVPIRSESETPPTTSLEDLEATSPLSSEHTLSDSDVRSSEHKVGAIKNTFDLNLQPASTDSDFQSNDQDSFGLSNSSLITG